MVFVKEEFRWFYEQVFEQLAAHKPEKEVKGRKLKENQTTLNYEKLY